MATANFKMQAVQPDGVLFAWVAPFPDWAAERARPLPDGGVYTDVAISGGGFEITAEGGGASADQVTAGGVSVVAGGETVLATVRLVTAGGIPVTVSGVQVAA